MPTAEIPAYDHDLVAAARNGDEPAFERLIAPHRGEIHALCYRMLGSLHDAEDASQEAFLRAWRAINRFEGRSSVRTWLHRIATNVCLDEIAQRPKRVLPIDYGPPAAEGARQPERVEAPIWLEPYPDDVIQIADDAIGPEARYEQRETLELAFVAALQHLPPRQRVVFVLRDALGFPAATVAEMLSASPASVNSALQRARETVDSRLPDHSQQHELRRLGDDQLREFVRRLVDAFENGHVETIMALLAADAVFSMPPYPEWYKGHDQIAESWLLPEDSPTGLRFLSARANGQLALGVYKLDAARNLYVPSCLEVFGLRGELISEVTAFRDVELMGAFGLPELLRR
ncbi:MAG TPA: sigma-70 family RNA polymerase sigma factor [Thermoleophilaceae bacterium]|nr:sigma-70 family RNA polymerase sigma factor [Thermoleophilaceae bacterium]